MITGFLSQIFLFFLHKKDAAIHFMLTKTLHSFLQCLQLGLRLEGEILENQSVQIHHLHHLLWCMEQHFQSVVS